MSIDRAAVYLQVEGAEAVDELRRDELQLAFRRVPLDELLRELRDLTVRFFAELIHELLLVVARLFPLLRCVRDRILRFFLIFF